jgi:hypothetical protein
MIIQPTEIQLLELIAQGDCEHNDRVALSYDQGWNWQTQDRVWQASDAEAADALLERVCELENEMMDLRVRARLGDALNTALEAQALVDQLDSSSIRVQDSE